MQRAPERPWWGLGDVAAGILVAQVLSLVVVVIVYTTAGWTEATDVPLWATALLQMPLWAGLAGTALYVSRLKGNGPVQDYGLKMKLLDVPLGLLAGIACQLLVLPLLYWPLLQLLGRSSDELSEPAEDLAGRASGTTGWVLLTLIVVAAAPLVEELFYRGLLLRSLERRGWPTWAVVVGSAAVFAAMHFQALQFPGLFVFGCVLALLACFTGRLGPSIWAHVGFNATTVVSLYIQSH
ncbi:MAG: CPBP family intramembrane glutamic endopeptidase [Microthrixaceae bacterium]